VSRDGDVAALVELKSETDFVAKSPQFLAMAEELAAAVAAEGEGAVDSRKDALDDLRITLKENIQVGRVVRLVAEAGQVLESYVHVQNGRGVNAVLVQLDGGTPELAHDLAVHVAFGKPSVLSRDEVAADEVAAERATLEAQTRNEGKPEAAIEKIVEGKLNGWYKRVPGGVLLEQPYAKDDKISVTQFLGGVKVIRFAQAVIGS
jgi:elongation factor Ts